MRSVATTAALLLLCSATLAADDDNTVWIASGAAGGSYRDVYATNLQRELRDYRVFHRETTGSGENLDLLADAKVDLAFAQTDLYADRLKRDPERYSDLVVLGKLADECVYIAHRKNGDVRKLTDLERATDGRAAKIAVGPEQSGMSGTWGYMTALRPELAQASVDHQGGTLALNQLGVGTFDAVGWVTDPKNLNHKLLRAVKANDDLALMALDDPALVDSLPDGTQVYRLQTVKTDESWTPEKLSTICTSAMLFARKDASPKLIGKVSDLVSLHLKRIAPSR